MWNFQENVFRTNTNIVGGGTPPTLVRLPGDSSDSCGTCWLFQVNVPAGQEYKVDVAKFGSGKYMSVGQGLCDVPVCDVGVNCTPGVDTDVDLPPGGPSGSDESYIFRIGISAVDSGSPLCTVGVNCPTSTNIVVKVYLKADLISPIAADVWTRGHDVSPIFC